MEEVKDKIGIYICFAVKIFSILFLLGSNYGFSQSWQRTKVSDYFEDITIMDYSLSDSSLWVCSNEVIKADGENFVKYNFDQNSSGKLADFECDDCDGDFTFIEVISKDNIVFLYDGKRNFLKIKNDSVFNYKFKDFPDKGITLGDFSIDNNDNLWFVVIYNKKLNYKDREKQNQVFKTYHTKDNDILEYKNPYNSDSLYTRFFYVKNEVKYMIRSYYNKNNEKRFIELLVFSDKGIKAKYKLKEHRVPSYEYIERDNKLFILDDLGYLYVIQNDMEMVTYETPLNAQKSCFSFEVVGDDIYYTFRDGMTKYNYITEDESLVPIDYPPSNAIFRKLKYRDGNIWGTYNIWNGPYNCYSIITNGFGVLKLK